MGGTAAPRGRLVGRAAAGGQASLSSASQGGGNSRASLTPLVVLLFSQFKIFVRQEYWNRGETNSSSIKTSHRK